MNNNDFGDLPKIIYKSEEYCGKNKETYQSHPYTPTHTQMVHF